MAHKIFRLCDRLNHELGITIVLVSHKMELLARYARRLMLMSEGQVILDPRHRDRSGLGLPVLRITYDMQPNEHRLSEFMEAKAEQILRAMGATRTWRGPRFSGVVSSHELGGCRTGEDPAASVVGPELRVHDTPGLYVFSTAPVGISASASSAKNHSTSG